MSHKYRPAWQLFRAAVLFCVLGLALGRFTYTAKAAFTNACVAGSFQSWNPTSSPMIDNLDGTFSLNVPVTAGDHYFKVTDCVDWPGAVPDQNFWFNAASDTTVTIHFDTNTFNDGFEPSTNLITVEGENAAAIPTTWTAVGDWQSEAGATGGDWQNGAPETELTAQGGGIYTGTFTIATAGTYSGKITRTGAWDKQFTSTGRAVDGGNISFTTINPEETITVTLNTNTNRFEFQPNGDGITQAAQDNEVWWGHLGHDSRDSLYRTPGGPVEVGTDVTLRFRSAKNDLTGAKVRIWNDRSNIQMIPDMVKVGSDDAFDYYEYTVDTGTETNVFYYRFIAIDGTDTEYYEDTDAFGGWGETLDNSADKSWQITVYDPAFQTPDWVQTGVVYQIFVDRFRDGDGNNNTEDGAFFYDEAGGAIVRSSNVGANPWNTVVCDPRQDTNDRCEGSYSRNFYGGDLQGVIDKLDYLQDMGVTVIYLNPIFESPSNHKYDATDFGIIDDNFGDLTLFQTLTTEAHNRGINIVLDGVFNHTSSDSHYFDRYGNFVDYLGACEDITSTFRDWYFFTPSVSGPCDGPATYESWAGYDSLPKLNSSNPDVRDLIWDNGTTSIGPYWMQWADGWRLDVGGDVDPGLVNNPSNDYWEGFRAAVHATNPDAYIVGEEWGNGSPWLLGNEWDAVMNYQFSSALLSYWRDTAFTDNDHNDGSSAGPLNPISSSVVNNRLLSLQERYAPESFAAMMNLLGSHDTSRALFMLDEGHPDNPSEGTVYPPAGHDWSDAITRLKGVALMQFTLPGAPTIYYGDEVGLVGPQRYTGGKWEDDPYNRQPYPWLDLVDGGTPFYSHLQNAATQDALRNYYTTLANTRNAHLALSIGDFNPLLVQDYGVDVDPLYVYGRKLVDHLTYPDDAAVVFVNRSSVVQPEITVSVAGYLPVGAVFDDALTLAEETYTVEANGELTALNVPARSGAILVLTSGSLSAPAAIADLNATSAVSKVTLNWTASAGADHYVIYRSTFSGGDYEYLSDTNSTTFEDNGVTNGTTYYYVVVAEDTTSSLVSGYSNEVVGLPQWNLTTAYRNLQWPFTITHTISTTVPTADVYGQIYVSGATEAAGQAPGIRAQLGYGPDGVVPTDSSWTWKEMAFSGQADNNDEYKANMLPESVGEFDYTIRYSSDNGVTWFYATERNNGGSPIGDMTVNASTDITDPSAPTLSITADNANHINLSWTASTDDFAVDRYRVYRSEAGQNDFSLIKTTTTTSYDDTTVVSGTDYDYYVTAVDTSFNQSSPSNTVTGSAVNSLISVTFVTYVPATTPDETIFIVGDQDIWGPWNPNSTAMTQDLVDPTKWTWTHEFFEGTSIEYKHTRGSWDKVEKDADGFTEISHKFVVNDEGGGTQTSTVTVLNWRDPYVVAHTPADGAVDVPYNTTVTVTWNKSMPSTTTFSITNSNDETVAGTFAYDDPTRTVTFSPDAPLANDLYTVLVSGKASGGDNQQVPTSFSFTAGPVLAQPFTLTAPADDAVYYDFTTPTQFDWTESTNAVEYTLTITRISDSSTVVTKTVTTTACSAGACSVLLEAADQSLLTQGEYNWTVTATNGVSNRSATNAPFSFAIDIGLTSFALLTPTDGTIVIDASQFAGLVMSWQETERAETYNFTLTTPAGVLDYPGLTPDANDDTLACDTGTCTLTLDVATVATENGNYSWNVIAYNTTWNAQIAANSAFSFTVAIPAPTDFALISPADATFFADPSSIAAFSWGVSNAAGYTPEYNFSVFKVSNDGSFRNLGLAINYTNLTAAADTDVLTCDATTCTLVPTAIDQSALTTGVFIWFAQAIDEFNPTSVVDASNASFMFTVNTTDLELVKNGGFEINNDGKVAVPDLWKRTGVSLDKVVSGAAKVHSGTYSYEFAPSAKENSRLTQNASILGVTNGDILNFSAWAKGGAKKTLRFRITVSYVGGTPAPTVVTVPANGATTGFQEYTGTVNIVGDVAKISVLVQNRTKVGKVYVDDISLIKPGVETGPRSTDGFIPLPGSSN